MDFIIEFFVELYMELMMLIVPEKGAKTKKILAALLAVVVIAITFVLVIWGISLIADKRNLLGIIPIVFAIIISVAQIVLGIIFYNKNH